MNSVLLSHPEKLLLSHLTEVSRLAVNSIKDKELNLSFDYQNEDIDLSNLIIDLVYLSSAFHDIGKATVFFQNYIKNPTAKHDKLKSHALISAVFVFHVVEEYLKDKGISPDLSRLISSLTFSAVKRHHGRLLNLSDEILIDDEWRELLIEQSNAINSDDIQLIIDKLLSGFNLHIEWKQFAEYLENQTYNEVLDDFSFDVLQDSFKGICSSTQITLFYIHQFIYSALLFADKNEVILNNHNLLQQIDIVERTENYRELKGFNKPNTEINSLKNEAYYSSLNQLEKIFCKTQHIYSVTLPTGLGKTITAYMLADKMRQLAGFSDSKIIINIPFTSIIDQNFDVYAEILQTKNSDSILKHHHLAEPVYKTNENYSDYYQSKFLIETWQSDTIVTTFVQLLETIFSCDKTKIMKFSNMANSVILLDEIQTVPYELWETIRETFKILGEKFNIYFILISATQPLIFTPNEDIVELVPVYQKYFRFFNRTKLIIKEKQNLASFKNSLAEYITNNPTKDILSIVNTKRAAREIFDYIKDSKDVNSIDLFYLTTLITPFERKEIIKRIKQKSNKQKVIISTQLVEAGVDISVHTVFRQIAPLDSIIQAAGRANRYNEKQEISEVFVLDIEDYRKVSNLVYGNDLLIKTENVLGGLNEVEEKDFIKLIENYFKEIRKQSDNTSQPLLNAIRNLDFQKIDFELIEQRKTDSVFIQLNETAKKLWNKYAEIHSQTDLNPWERDELFSNIKNDFYDFVINVPIPRNRETIAFDSEKEYHFYVSKLENPSQNYSYTFENIFENTGYKDMTNSVQVL